MNKAQEKAAVERASDPELLTVNRIMRMLRRLPDAARSRVMRYVNDRMGEPQQKELPLDGQKAPGA